MEPLTRPAVTRHTLAALLLLAAASGCVTWKSLTTGPDIAPRGTVCQVVATWDAEVRIVPDSANGGKPTPGLAGRLYLFGPEIKHPLVGDGSVVVDLYDDAPMAQGKPPILLEEWRIDKDTLKKLLRRDMLGWGYTLFLPWGSYRPDVTQVHLQLRYEPTSGVPLYADQAALVLNRPGSTTGTVVTNSSMKPRG